MKLFYVLAMIVVALMVLSPYYFLRGEDNVKFDKVLYGYEADGTPIYKGLVDGCKVKEPVITYHGNGGLMNSKDPSTCGDSTSGSYLWNIYEGLYGYHYLKKDGDEPVIKPVLADGMPQISEDRLTWTIKIKKGVKYNRNACFGKLEGKEGVYKTRDITAHDFELAFKRIADGYNSRTYLAWGFLHGRIVGLDEFRAKSKTNYDKGDFSRYDKEKVEGVKALDDHTLQIKLKKPYPQFKFVLALANYAPVPREAVKFWLAERSEDMEKPAKIEKRKSIAPAERRVEFMEDYMLVGTGAYRMHSYKHKKHIILVRNPDYREDTYPPLKEIAEEYHPAQMRKELGLKPSDALPRYYNYTADCGKKVPFIDVYVFENVEESNTAWLRFLSRQTDAGGIPKETFDSVITPDKGLTDAWKKKGIYLRTAKRPTVYWFTLNMENKLFANSPSLRRAMALAFDVEQYLDTFTNNRGQRVTNCMPSTFNVYKKAGDGEFWGRDIVAAVRRVKSEGTKDPKDIIKAIKADRKKVLEKANELMKKAYKELELAGVIEKGQKIPPIYFLTANDGESGKFVEFLKQQFSDIGVEIRGDFNDRSILSQKIAKGEFDMGFGGWGADYFDAENFLQLYYSPNIKAGYNQSRYNNPEYDKLFEKAKTMADGPEKIKLTTQMAQMVANDCPVIMLFEPEGMALSYVWYQNVISHPFSAGFMKYKRIDHKLRKKWGGRE